MIPTRCEGCGKPLQAQQDMVSCPGCGSIYHQGCFEATGCISAECAGGSGVQVKPPLETGPHAAAQKLLRSRRGRHTRDNSDAAIWLLYALGVALSLALAAAALWLFFRPSAMAERDYRAGVQLMARGDLAGARVRLERALGRSPEMAQAHLALGFAQLGIADGDVGEEGIEQLLEKAKWGRTEQLDSADVHLNACIRIVVDRQGSSRSDGRHLVSNAWMGRAATALVRAAAAYETAHGKDGDAWVAVALAAAEQCMRTFPNRNAETLARLARDMKRSYHK